MDNKDRRKNKLALAYLFFLFELVFITELAYVYTSIFGTQPLVLVLLGFIIVYILNGSVKRLLRVVQRIKFTNYGFSASDQN